MANFTCSCNGNNNNNNGVLGSTDSTNGCGCGCGCGCGGSNGNGSNGDISDILGDRDEMSTQDLLTIIAIVLLLIGFFCTGN